MSAPLGTVASSPSGTSIKVEPASAVAGIRAGPRWWRCSGERRSLPAVLRATVSARRRGEVLLARVRVRDLRRVWRHAFAQRPADMDLRRHYPLYPDSRLHFDSGHGRTGPTGMSDDTSYAADWETKIAFARARGLTSAKWSSDGQLTEATLGPAIIPPTEEETIRATQPSASPQARQQQERDQRRGLAQRASGGPVRRLDAND